MSNHVDRVRSFVRARRQMAATPHSNVDPDLVYTLWVLDERHDLTLSDLDAICRDAERLQEVEDL